MMIKNMVTFMEKAQAIIERKYNEQKCFRTVNLKLQRLEKVVTENEDDFEDLQTILETFDNKQRMYILLLKGLKQGLEEDNLVAYLEEFFLLIVLGQLLVK